VRNEGDVRTWVREQLGDESFWVEAAAGGTVGMADCLWMMDGRLWPIELKYGNVEAGWWSGSLRPQQEKVGRRMMAGGVGTWILVGEDSDDVLWMMDIEVYFEAKLGGDKTKMCPVIGRSCMVQVVNERQ
tara:strand:+ start:21670 stop:22059 length:390 start_codon:yes stop_codon:yes gene_type:complete